MRLAFHLNVAFGIPLGRGVAVCLSLVTNLCRKVRRIISILNMVRHISCCLRGIHVVIVYYTFVGLASYHN